MTSDKREKAIKYLTEEIRSLRMAPEINGCPMTPEWAEQISVMETCLQAVRAYPPAHIDREAWVSVEEKLPDAEEEVRLLCVTSWGRHYQCQGFYVPPGTYRDDSGYSWDWECCEEYDEERDDYLVNPGWYESIHNWDEYSACGIADKVTNWMPLPEPPESRPPVGKG